MTSENISSAKPGSPEAIKQGCTCPQMDNHDGKGIHGLGELYVINTDCPVHGMGHQNK